MAFCRSDLQEAFFVPGTYAFRVYGYGTTDPLEQVLAPDYFAAARGLLRAGELIYVSTCPQEARGSRAEPGEPRMALVMVRADERDAERAGGAARLAPRANHRGRPGAARVQDFGRPGGAPVKRGRGRPRGSRTKKPA